MNRIIRIFARAIIIGMIVGALISSAFLFLTARRGLLPPGWFWGEYGLGIILRGALTGWILGIIVGSIIALVTMILGRFSRTKSKA